MTLKKLLLNLDLIYGIPHELAHYITGQLIGVAVILDLKQRRVLLPKDTPVWKNLVITVAPTILGFVLIGCFLSVPFVCGLSRTTAQITLWGSTYGLIILLSCIGTDWRGLIRYWTTGKIT